MHTSRKAIPVFGELRPGVDYLPRPGAYAVILNGDRLAVIRTQRGTYFLPGGGCAEGETPLAALRREVREECGCDLHAGPKIGQAIEYLFAEAEDRYYRIEATFFTAALGKRIADSSEPEHDLVWLEVGRALGFLARKSQVWAVRRALDLAGKEPWSGPP